MLVGAARRIINAENGHNLCGYGPDYPNSGVHDDLSVTALYLDDGQRQAVLFNYDLLGLAPGTIDDIRSKVGAKLGISVDHVFLTCTHTHSAPDPIEAEPYDPESLRDRCRPEYVQALKDWTIAAAEEAKGNAEECELRYNFAFADENMNRRFTFPDRRFLYIPANKQLVGQSHEYVDRELGILAFRKKGPFLNQYKAIITNYTCHPLCVGNTSNLQSADFQGVLRRRIEESFDGCLVLSTTGAAGDNHPKVPEGGFVAAEAMGNRLAEIAIARTYDAVTVTDEQQLRLAYPRVTIPLKDDATVAMLPSLSARNRWKPEEKEHSSKVCLLGIGPILFAGVPGELVASLGAMLKWSSPFLRTYVLYVATDYVGYIPAVNQIYFGGYEADTSPLRADAGLKLVMDIVAQAQALVAKDPLKLPALDVPLSDGKAR